MIRQILFVFFFGFHLLSYSQTCNLILTYEENQNWLDSFRNSPFDKRIDMFKERMLCDTLIKVKKRLETNAHHESISINETTYLAENRLEIYFTFRKMIYNRILFRNILHKDLKYLQFKRANDTKSDKIIEICNFISKSKLSGFYCLSPSRKYDMDSELIWGAVIIDFKRKKDFETFNRLIN